MGTIAMFGWIRSAVPVCSPAEARQKFLRGDPPAGMRVQGRLQLANLDSLTALPRNLHATAIDVSGCTNLTSLPPGLNCQELIIRRTNVAWLPPDLRVSRRIDAQECRRLRILPPIQVEQLNLRSCSALDQLPAGLAVRWLDISHCTRLTEVPASIASSIEHLHASGCTHLARLPEELTRLVELDLRGCRSLRKLPDRIKVRSWIDVADSSLTSLPWSLRSVRLLWNGEQVSDRVAFDPQSITAEEVLNETNVDFRRLLLDRMGVRRFVETARAQVLDRDRDTGGERQLLRIRFDGGEDIVCVVVHCPSTGSRYLLRVPPDMQSCRQAVAWTAGFSNPEDYQPVMET